MRLVPKRGAMAVAVGVAVAVTTAVSAEAIPPPPSGLFTGNTSQTDIPDNSVRLRTDANGHVSKMKVGWEAKCQVKGKSWGSTTTISPGANGLPMTGDVFKKNKTYTGDAGNGITGRITYVMKGHFTDNDNATGSWKAHVIVR